MKRCVSVITKEKVVWRDSWICQICTNDLIENQWHCDHIQPLWEGGSNEMQNLQAICANCHAGKTAEEQIRRLRKKREEKEERWKKEAEERRLQFPGLGLERFIFDGDL